MELGESGTPQRLMRGVAASAFDKLVLLAFQLALVPVYVAHWGVAQYGAWLLLATLPTWLALGDFGFATAAANAMTMRVATGDRAGAAAVFDGLCRIIRMVSVGVATLAGGLIWLLPDTLLRIAPLDPQTVRVTLSLLLVYGLCALQTGVAAAGFNATGRFAVGRTGTGVIFLGEGLAVAAALFAGGGPVAVAAALAAVRVTGAAVLRVLAQRQVRWLRADGAGPPVAARALVRPALAALALPASNALFLQGSVLALGLVASPANVAAFATTRTLARIGVQVTMLLSHPLMPEFAAAAARGNRARMAKMLAATLLTSLTVVGPAALVLLVAGQALVALWTHGAIHPSWLLVAAMAAVTLINGCWAPVANLLLAMNRQAAFARAYLLLAAGCVALTALLAGPLGAAGGAVGMLAMDIIMLAVVYRRAARKIAAPETVAAVMPAVAGQLTARLSALRTTR